jgi:DNA-binding transcriptional regulator YiaG
MKSCVQCKGSDLRDVKDTHDRSFLLAGGQAIPFRFDEVPQTLCGTCGERYFAAGIGTAEDNAVTRELLERQIRDPAVFKWFRRCAGLKATELAELLGVTAETISHWENGHTQPSRAVWTILDALVEDEIKGHTTTLDRLRAPAESRIPKRPVRLSLKAANG